MKPRELPASRGVLCALALFLLFILPAGAQNVTFADTNLEAVVRQTLGIPKPTPITQANMLTLTNLYATAQNISALGGLEYARNLDTLVLNLNNISDLTPLSGLTNVHTLDLTANQITDPTPIANLSQITWLNLATNKMTRLPSLALLNHLPFLDVSYNLLTNITGASGMPITWMSARGNRLETLVGLAGLTNLQTCILSDNYILLVGSLGLFTNLTWMSLSNNNVQDIHTLTNLTHLGYLDLRMDLLDTSANSPAMLAIAKMQSQGTTVDYTPQKNFQNAVVTLSKPTRVDPSHFQFQIAGPPGISLKVLRATVPKGGWSQIGTTFVSTGTITFQDSAGPVPTLFYETSQ